MTATFHTTARIENHVDRRRSFDVEVLVDSGSECTWVPRQSLEKLGIRREKKNIEFVITNGEHVTRNVGFAIVRVGKYLTTDEVVFAEPGDLLLLGARTLEGLNLTIDSPNKRLLPAGPLPAATPVRLRR